MADRSGKISSSPSNPSPDTVFGRADYINNVLDAVRIGVVLVEFGGTPDSVIYHRSRTLEEIMGIPSDYPQDSASWMKLLVEPEKMLSQFNEQFGKRIPVFETVYRIKRPADGEIRWIYGKGRLEFSDDGKPVRLIGTVQDITVQKQLEENLNRFRIAAENSFDSIFWLDENARFTYVNEQACRSLGYRKDELLGLSLWDIDPVFPKERWSANWASYTAGKRMGEHIETVHRRKDGTTFPVEVVSMHLKLDDAELHISSVRDITKRKEDEHKLRESEAKVANIIKAMPSGMHLYHLEPDGRLVFDGANPSADRIIGVDHSIFIGKTIEEAFPPLIDTDVPAMYRRAARDGISWKTEQITYHEGRIAGAFEVHAFQIEPGRMAAVFTEISERKRAEEEITFQNVLLKAQQENSPDGILVVDEKGKILYFNQRFTLMWGIPEELLKTRDDGKVLEYAIHRASDPKQFMEKVQYLYSHNEESSFDEFTFTDGRSFERFSGPVTGADGHCYGRVWYFRDVTEHKNAIASARKREAEFRTLFESIPSGAAMIVDRKFRKVSARFCEITGYSEDELFNQPTRILFPDDATYRSIEHNLYSLIDDGGLGRIESTFRKKDGSLIDVQISATMLPQTEQGQRSIVSTFEDISQRKAAEADKEKLQNELIQSQKMESIGRLAGGIAHDFNNLLTAIMGNTELALLKTPPSHPLHSQLSTVMQAAESASDLTRQLLAFSRKQIIVPRIVDLNNLIETMHKMLTRVIGENITLRAVPQPGLHPVKVDFSQIQQIIMNLAINARDAMPDGGILSIETGNVVIGSDFGLRHDYPATGDHVMLAVTDTGTGMNDSVKSHLFEPFFTTKAAGKGTGLGLATVYGAVKQNKGIIDVYSELDKGTCFKVYFPAAEGTAAAPAEQKNDTLPCGSETVLIVEDNPMVLRFSESALRLLGYTVYTAASGEEALDMISGIEKRVDLVMTDVTLSGMTGKALADTLEERYPGIRILFNSGYTEDSIVAHGVLNGNLNFIGKPFSAAALARKIREILDRK